jgi:hypothetical protein
LLSFVSSSKKITTAWEGSRRADEPAPDRFHGVLLALLGFISEAR